MQWAVFALPGAVARRGESVAVTLLPLARPSSLPCPHCYQSTSLSGAPLTKDERSGRAFSLLMQ